MLTESLGNELNTGVKLEFTSDVISSENSTPLLLAAIS
jgi:hypothetical protein